MTFLCPPTRNPYKKHLGTITAEFERTSEECTAGVIHNSE